MKLIFGMHPYFNKMKYGRRPQILEKGRRHKCFLNGRQPQFCSRQSMKLIFCKPPYLTKLDEIWKTTSIFF